MILRPRPIVNKKVNSIIAFLIFVGTLTVYYLTQARSLSFWDAGEYVTCSSILGVPHPPGNPFYILLGHFITNIFSSSAHAFVVNILSGIFSALAVMLTYLFTVKLVSMFEENKLFVHLSGFIAAFYIAFTFSFWNNAIEAEVYAGLALTINLIIWLTMVWVEKSRGLSHQNILLLIIYIFFLGFGIHQTSLQIAPAVLFIVLYPMIKDLIKTSDFWYRALGYGVGLLFIYFIANPIGKSANIPDLPKILFAIGALGILYFNLKDKVENKAWLLSLLLVAIGLSTHIFLWVRAELEPFINEGDPSSLERFTDYVLRRQYGVTSFLKRRASFIYQMKDQFLKYFGWQFFNGEMLSRWLSIPAQSIKTIGNLIIWFLGLFGAIDHYKRNKHSFFYLFAFFFMASFAMVFVMNLSDSEVRQRDYFYVTAYNLWTVWLGIGSIGLLRYLKKAAKPLIIFGLIITIGLPIVNFASHYHPHDRSKEFVALDYGLNLLNGLEENAIIFTNGDNDTFPLWYVQAVKDPNAHEYVYDMTKVKPTKRTKKRINQAMKYKNEECNGLRKDVTVANLSLLNTPWYIKQLKYKEGIIFDWSDKEIDNLNPTLVVKRQNLSAMRQHYKNEDISIIPETTINIKGTEAVEPIKIRLKQKEELLYIKDLAVLRIIQKNYGKRPIYFAVTVSDVVEFGNYLENEGMVDRVVSQKGKDKINIDRLANNIENVYTYRGIFDKAVYKDRNMKRLINNYGASYIRASYYYSKTGNIDMAIKYMKDAIEFVDNKDRFLLGLSQLYQENNQYEKAAEVVRQAIKNNPNNPEHYLQAGRLMIQSGKTDMINEAYNLFENALVKSSNLEETAEYIAYIARTTQTEEKAIKLLDKLDKQKYPRIKRLLTTLKNR